MASKPHKPGKGERRTSEAGYRPSVPNADRPTADDKTESRRSARTGDNVKTSRSNPRAPKTAQPQGTRTFDQSLPQPTNFTHGPLQKDKEENAEATSEPIPRPVLSGLITGFVLLRLADYRACERYCKSNPGIWSQDANELRKLRELVIIYLQEQKHDYARRCAERWMMITIAQHRNLSADDANSFLKSLSVNDLVFQSELDRFIENLGREDVPSQVVASSSESRSQPLTTSSNSRQPARWESANERTNEVRSAPHFQYSSGQVLQQDAQRQSHQIELTIRGPKSPSIGQATYKGQALVTAPKVAVSVAEEVSEIFSETVMLDEERPELVIDERTKGMGPDLRFISTKEERDELNASYKLRTGREAEKFFLKGRVFAMVWHENVGIPPKPNSPKSNSTEASAPLDKPFHRFTRNADGVTIFSHIRRFVIVKATSTRRYCWAIPINSYSGRGLTDKRMLEDEKQAHTIIHGIGSEPVRMKGEIELDKEPIAVKMEPGEELTPSSRLHFGKVQCIDWNVRLKKIGRIVDKKNMRRLILYFKEEFHKGDDTTTEAEESQVDRR